MYDRLKRKRLSTGGETRIPDGQAAQVFDIGNGLRIHFCPFDIELTDGLVPCWVYRSEGLRRWGQAELLFALSRKAGAAPPMDPVYHTQAVGTFAAKGQTVNCGGYTVFGPSHPGLFGRREFRGVGYIHPFNLEGAVPAPALATDHLADIALTEHELYSVQRHGMARTLARLGEAIRFYPYPAWTDPGRREVIDKPFLDASFLQHARAISAVEGFAPIREEGAVQISLSASEASKMADALELAIQKEMLILFPTTAGWDRCMACLTWHPGSRGPVAITAAASSDVMSSMQAQGQSLLGCFLGYVPTKSHQEGIKMIEDGFCLLMGPQSATGFIRALRNRQPFGLVGQGKLSDFKFSPL